MKIRVSFVVQTRNVRNPYDKLMNGSKEYLEPLGALRQPLEALGELLGDAGEEHHLLIVGGVAILLHRIRSRATTDVDVIARVERNGFDRLRLVAPDPLPPVLAGGIARVSRDFDLPADWLNAAVGQQWREGKGMMPPALLEEAEWHVLGGLHIGIAGRRSLISLKLYAAADTGPGSVHTQDLLALQPTQAELEQAENWVRQQDPSPGFQELLGRVINHVEQNAPDA